jgi:hypothetical protein
VASKVPALIDYLVALFTAAPTLGAATPPVAVYDGPATTAQNAKLVLWVGLADPDTIPPQPAATFEQSRADMGQLTRDEVSVIRCAAEAWTGDVNGLPDMRRAAFAIVAAVENIVRADTSQFGGNADLAAPGVTGGELLQDNPIEGPIARVVFQITFRSFT